MSNDLLKEILFEALERPADERPAYLARACGSDQALRQRVEHLLEAHDEAGGFMDNPTTRAVPEGASPPEPAASAALIGPNTQIGRYRIIRQIGEGGFGTVFLAEQLRPVVRPVALKILKPGMDSREVIARFQAERQALAIMDHPCIATVFDAGTTDTGRPYFVMEYVNGDPITSYCDRRRLGMRERLEIFEAVCLAVQHAHQKGMIHRDLKPSNVLVIEVDGRPVPKVIDFGIAKAVGPGLGGATVITTQPQLLGTPEYMSPEQVALTSENVDTRSDVYSLGVLLYELLCGTPPFDPARLRSGGLIALQRIICGEEPVPPSTRFEQLGDARSRISEARAAELSHLERQLKGDLDWITMRAMEKDPVRRYQTAYDLAMEVKRHLAGDPVEAGPPSRTYRLSKFVRRHRIEVAAATVVVLALIGVVVFSVFFAARADRARRAADRELAKYEALADFSQSILSGLDPAVARGQDTTLLRRILDDATKRIETELTGQPEVDVSIRLMIGETLVSLGDFDAAEQMYERAARTGTEQLGADHELSLDAQEHLCTVYVEQSRFDEAEPLMVNLLERRTRVQGPEHLKTLQTLGNLAVLYSDTGRWALARQELEALLRLRQRTFGDDHESMMVVRNNLASALSRLGEEEKAVELLEVVMGYQKEHLSGDHPRLLMTMNNLAGSYEKLGRLDETEAMYREVLEAKRRVLPEGHPSILVTENNLGTLYSRLGRYEAAEELLLPALERSRQTLGDQDIRTLTLMHSLGSHYRRAKQYEQSEALLKEALGGLREALGDNHPNVLFTTSQLAGLYQEMDRLEDAEPLAAEVVSRGAKVLGVDDPRYGQFLRLLGEIRTARGRPREADSDLFEAHRILSERLGPDDEQTIEAVRAIVAMLRASGRNEEAEAWGQRIAQEAPAP